MRTGQLALDLDGHCVARERSPVAPYKLRRLTALDAKRTHSGGLRSVSMMVMRFVPRAMTLTWSCRPQVRQDGKPFGLPQHGHHST